MDSIQAPDVAAANSGSLIIVNANQALPPYRSKEGEIGYKAQFRRVNFSTAMFRIDRPFANYVANVVNPVCGTQSGTANCESYQITGDQVNYGIETMISGRVFERLMLTGGLEVLNPKLTDTGIAATNNKNFVGIPDYKSNILAEYQLPILTGAFLPGTGNMSDAGRSTTSTAHTRHSTTFSISAFGTRPKSPGG